MQVPPLPVPRWDFAVVVLNDSLLVMGGAWSRWSFICDRFETVIINAFAVVLALGCRS